VNGIVGHTWAINDRTINEFRFQYAHRGLEFNPSNIGDTTGDTDLVPDGQEIANQHAGYRLFRREPFSFVHRTEDRYQFVDNFSWTIATIILSSALTSIICRYRPTSL